MRRLTLFISVALALLAFAVPATAGAKSHHSKRHHRVADRNHNGIPDRWERRFRVHKATADPDRDGVTIGERAVIGANSVVTTDVSPYSIVAGVPARVLKPDWRLPGVGGLEPELPTSS